MGWQGITVEAPDDWSLVGVNGDEKKGYFRVDSPVASALEVRWSQAFGKTPELTVKAREFVSGLRKASEKRKVKFSEKIKEESDGSVSFNWRSDQLGQGRLIYCQGCDRVIVAQVISSRDEGVSAVVPAILGSLTDHRDDGWITWALYGLRFAVPAGYKLDKQSLMSGYLSLAFRNRAKTLVVERWGLAETLMAGESLETWFRKDVSPDIKGHKYTLTESEYQGHKALELSGRRSGMKQMAKAVAASLTLYPHPGFITGYTWLCDESNKIFSVRATHTQNDSIAEDVRDLIKCH